MEGNKAGLDFVGKKSHAAKKLDNFVRTIRITEDQISVLKKGEKLH